MEENVETPCLTVLHLSRACLLGYLDGYYIENYAKNFTFIGHEWNFSSLVRCLSS